VKCPPRQAIRIESICRTFEREEPSIEIVAASWHPGSRGPFDRHRPLSSRALDLDIVRQGELPFEGRDEMQWYAIARWCFSLRLIGQHALFAVIAISSGEKPRDARDLVAVLTQRSREGWIGPRHRRAARSKRSAGESKAMATPKGGKNRR